ncbi:hypothetical protein CDD83_2034 [Cordyceps sp. RAO-2017]|nr:hypothetical protein CDD83_2034 [Cordyceps sp. RAO-2017]
MGQGAAPMSGCMARSSRPHLSDESGFLVLASMLVRWRFARPQAQAQAEKAHEWRALVVDDDGMLLRSHCSAHVSGACMARWSRGGSEAGAEAGAGGRTGTHSCTGAHIVRGQAVSPGPWSRWRRPNAEANVQAVALQRPARGWLGPTASQTVAGACKTRPEKTADDGPGSAEGRLAIQSGPAHRGGMGVVYHLGLHIVHGVHVTMSSADAGTANGGGKAPPAQAGGRHRVSAARPPPPQRPAQAGRAGSRKRALARKKDEGES